MASMDNSKSRGRFRSSTRYVPEQRLSKQEAVEVSRKGRPTIASSAGVCDRCNAPYAAGEADCPTRTPTPRSEKAWERVHKTCAPRLAQPRKWKFDEAA
jgi:hypothetical protein